MHKTVQENEAVMLIGAGVGFSSIGSLLGHLLQHNHGSPKRTCFIWAATKLEELHLSFWRLVVDLAHYVSKHENNIAALKAWLTIKIFVSSLKREEVRNFFGRDALQM